LEQPFLVEDSMQNKLKIAFIGGGNMATALIGGMLGKLTSAEHVHVVDVNPESLLRLEQQFGVSTATVPTGILRTVDVIVLAVKPQQMREVLAQLQTYVDKQLVLSIAAGIRASDMSRWLHGYDAIVRCMPNTPALIGLGITGMLALPGVSAQQKQIAEDLMRAAGQVVWVAEENQMDAVTAVSGSGPAYVFYFMEAMQQAAQELGLDAEQARLLTLATMNGAAQLALQSSEPVSVLRERVTSKGGTTYAALCSFEQSQLAAAIGKGMHAAAARGHELGDELGKQE
jgi:pyrroline-5-carboxylate reductase